jgi:hypothetical protein
MLTDDRNRLSGNDVVSWRPIVLPVGRIEVFFDDPLTARQSVTPAHARIMADGPSSLRYETRPTNQSPAKRRTALVAYIRRHHHPNLAFQVLYKSESIVCTTGGCDAHSAVTNKTMYSLPLDLRASLALQLQPEVAQ